MHLVGYPRPGITVSMKKGGERKVPHRRQKVFISLSLLSPDYVGVWLVPAWLEQGISLGEQRNSKSEIIAKRSKILFRYFAKKRYK